MRSILLTIHKEHAENILSGKKTIELRKIYPKYVEFDTHDCKKNYGFYDDDISDEQCFVVYFSIKGTKKVQFKAFGTIEHKSKNIFNLRFVSKNSCVDESFVELYFNNKHSYGYYNLIKIEVFDNPIELMGIKPPQNFIYVKFENNMLIKEL